MDALTAEPPTNANNELRERGYAMTDESKPRTFDELVERLRQYADPTDLSGGAGYEWSANAMCDAASLVFNFVASMQGVTGFQASWAALKFYGDVMHKTSPYMVIDVGDALYPQYDLHGRLDEFIDSNRSWLHDQAKAKLAEKSDFAHPNVVKHWEKLAEDDAA